MNKQNIGVLFPASVVLPLLLMAAATIGYGQTQTGNLSGVVRNEQGEVLKEVTVSITNIMTGEVRQVHTDKDGRYEFAFLEPGSYEWRVEGAGFYGNAITKVQPDYPPTARMMGAFGTVRVQVTISESGRVIEAKAISGHQSLRSAAVDAARKWIFTPTTLNGSPIKVRGVLSFNFEKANH
jgi:TonB family protein